MLEERTSSEPPEKSTPFGTVAAVGGRINCAMPVVLLLLFGISVSVLVVVELAVRPSGLERIEHYMSVFNAHLEAVSAVNLRKIVDYLSCLGGFVRRQEGIGAQSRQPTESESGQTAVVRYLWDTLDSVLRWNAVRRAFWPESRGVQVVPSNPRHIDRSRREQRPGHRPPHPEKTLPSGRPAGSRRRPLRPQRARE